MGKSTRETFFLAAAVALFLIVCDRAAAANGANLIGVTPTSLALGGTGVSRFLSVSDALHRNASLLGRTDVEPGTTIGDFSLFLNKNNASADAGAGLKSSSAGPVPVTNVSFAHILNSQWAGGVGIVSYAGTLNDQKDQAELVQLKVQSLVMRALPSIAFTPTSSLSLGASLVVAGGLLSIDDGLLGTQSTRALHGDIGLGAQFGVTYVVAEGWQAGASYQTHVKIDYPNIIDLDQFGGLMGTPGDDIRTEQPGELGLGVSYATGDWLFLVDYRWIAWSSSQGFRELGWQDQHAISLGVQRAFGAWKLRAGFNYAKSPINDASGESGTTTIDGHVVGKSAVSILNMVAFPALAHAHITVGAGWDISPTLSLELAAMYSPKATVTRSGTDLTATAFNYRGEVSQWSIGAGLKFHL